MYSHKELAIVIMAAGASTRLGQPKQLVKIENESLIYRQCRLALLVTPHVYCVIGCHADTLRKEIELLPLTIVENQQWQRGLGYSISQGVKQLPEGAKAVMLILVDQWKLSFNDLVHAINTYKKQKENILLSHYKSVDYPDAFGPPVIFPKRFFTKLIRLDGKEGAKPILQEYSTETEIITLPNAAQDLDTPEQLAALLAFFKQKAELNES